MKEIALFQGTRTMRRLAAVGLVGLALTLSAAAWTPPSRVMLSYLVAFIFWLGLALGMLAWLMTFHAIHARWVVVLRRVAEHASASLGVFVVLFLPILLWGRLLYPWAGWTAHLDEHARELVEHQRPYLNSTFLVLRAAFYFLAWLVIARLLRRWSLAQDADRDVRRTLWQRRLSSAALPLVGITVTFAAFDWIMSLDPRWASTIFGLYYLAGAAVGAMALLIVVVRLAERGGWLEGLLTPSHYHSMGKLLLSFVCFWAYIAFSQFMLVWVANLAHEIPWYQLRLSGSWGRVGWFLVVGHFVVPFFLLLSRSLKRNPVRLALVALWVLLAHYVDSYWIIVPRGTVLTPFHWADLTALAGVGGVALAFALWRARGERLVPIGDPYLEESLRYRR